MSRIFSITTLWAAMLLVGAGCPDTRLDHPRRRPRSTAALAQQLRLPPGREAVAAVDRLRTRARRGDSRARWELVHYGLDLFDFGRLTGDRSSRGLLWRLVGLTGAPGTGRSATRQVLHRLRTLGTALGGGGRPVGGAARRPALGGYAGRLVHLKAILASDAAFLQRRQSLASRVRVLRGLRSGPLRYAVLLRLYTPCAQAFRAAVLAPPAARPRILNYCLYSFYSIDPTPHLRRVRRLPDPPWTAYRQALSALLARVEASGGRAATIAARLRTMDERFFREEAYRLPLPLGDWVHLLPRIVGGRAVGPGPEILLLRDRFLAGGQVVAHPQPRHIRVALSRMFFAFGKGTHLTVFGPSSLKATGLRRALERAVDVGYYTVGLGGGRRIGNRLGYWRLTDAPMVERREVVLSLAPSSVAARMLKTLTPEQVSWDWRCAAHQLGLVLRPGGVTVVGPDGQLPMRPAAGDLPGAALAALRALRSDFPGECGVFVSPGPSLTVGQLVAVVERLQQGGLGQNGGFKGARYLGYRIVAPREVPGGGAFAARVALRRRARARVRGLPRRVASRAGSLERALRACYLAALDRSSARWAVLGVQPAGGRFLVTQQQGTAPEEISMNRCVEQAVKRWVSGDASTAPLARPFRVELRLSPPKK